MPKITTRNQLKEYCLRQCGAPVISINIADEQVDDAVDDALDFWRNYHYLGTESANYVVVVTQDMINNRRIKVDESICGVDEVHTNIGFASGTDDYRFLSPEYNTMEDVYQYGEYGTGDTYALQSYFVTNMFLNTLQANTRPAIDFNFTEPNHTIQIDINWAAQKPGSKLLIVGTRWVDPENNPEIYNDRVLRQLSAEYTRRTWGYNLLKFGNVVLPGGVQINGQDILNTANQNIQQLEQDFIYKYSEPLGFSMG